MKSARLLLVLVLSSLTSFAGTLRVPQDFPTVQGAVAASVAGDSVVISPGLYAIPAAPCTLANGSQHTCGLVLHDGTALVGLGPAQTVLDFSGADIGILLQLATATVKLLHLRNAATAIYAYVGSNITVTNVIITDLTGPSVLGMELNQGNSYTIHNTTIDNIHQPNDPVGTAIDVPFGGVSDIQNNLLTSNTHGVTAGSFSGGTYAYNNVFGSTIADWSTCDANGCTAVSAPANNISTDPLYCPDFTLQSGSPARSAGNPAILNSDGTRSDMGAYGGPEAIFPPTTCAGLNEFPIVTADLSYEPSIAVDPRDELHAVVGFNHLNGSGQTIPECDWAESVDGGASWTAPTPVPLPAGYMGRGDPWIRYALNGQLFYTCIAVTPFVPVGGNPFFQTRTIAILISRSLTGRATDFHIAVPIHEALDFCLGVICDEKSAEGPFLDAPSLHVLQYTDGTNRLVACWVEQYANNGFVRVSSSATGLQWSSPRTLAGPNTVACRIGGNAIATADPQRDNFAVTWLNARNDMIYFRTSRNADSWQPARRLTAVGPLLQFGSTMDKIVSRAYATPVEGPGGLKAIWQTRANGVSQVFIGNLEENSPGAVPAGDAAKAEFLPSDRYCTSAVGAYQVGAGQSFRYEVFSTLNSGVLFQSSADLDGANGAPDAGFPGFTRIGDYTSLDCSARFIWAAWTDVRAGKPQIWGSRFVLPR